jgi:hypothetical protein
MSIPVSDIRHKLYDYIRVADDKNFMRFITSWKTKLMKQMNGGKINALSQNWVAVTRLLKPGLIKDIL